jgi:hypothetical protein
VRPSFVRPPRPPGRPRRAGRVFALLLAGLPAPAAPSLHAQATAPGWNDARSLELVGEAIAARRWPWGDSALAGFDLHAEGRVHYVADFGGASGEQAIRADQVALELRWRRGIGSTQEIVGRRETEWLPTNIRYHVDHLTLVVENYGDRIRIGEGDEIRDVLHPLARGARRVYDYRLVDSVSLGISGTWHRLYRIEVRPRDPATAAVVGTLDLERTSLQLTRLAVSFTPAAYVDPRLVQVSVELENALIEGRAWLPYAQRVEIQRRMKWMELPFGSTIRSSFRVLEYDLDPRSRGVHPGHRIRARPSAELARYAGWRTPAIEAWPEEVRTDSVRLDEVRAEALSIARKRYMGGDARLRLYVPSVSSAFRVRRAEGVYLGAGARWEIDGLHALTAGGGWGFGRRAGTLEASLERRFGASTLSLEGWLDRPEDVGPFEAASGAIATIDAVARGDDWLDPYFRSGGALALRGAVGAAGRLRAAIVWEEHEAAVLELDPPGGTDARPVRPVDEGTDLRLELGLAREVGTWLGSRATASLDAELAAGGDFEYSRLRAGLVARPREPDAVWAWEGTAGAGIGLGTLPAQRLFLLGGRGTVPGYEFRPFGGDLAAFANVAVSRTAWHPWLRVRVLGAVGGTGLGSPGRDAAARFGAVETGDVRASLGAGVSLFYDLVRLDAARGLTGGRWEWILSVSPAFRAPL